MKRLVSFLGTGEYEETVYELGDSPGRRHKTRFVADALACLLDVDELFVLATCEAWSKHGDALREKLPGKVKAVLREIPAGQRREELEQQFLVLRDAVTENDPDTLILDITHGFRAQPFFAAGVFAQLHACGHLPRRTEVYYGEWRREGISPLWSLGAFVDLLGWAQGTAVMRHTGDGRLLVEALKKQRHEQGRRVEKRGGRFPDTARLIGAIERFSSDLGCIRIASMITGYSQGGAAGVSSAAELLNALDQYREEAEKWHPQLVPLFESLKGLAEGIDSSSLYGDGGLAAMQALAGRYLQLGRYPEAAVVVREGRISRYARGPEAVEVKEGKYSPEAREEAEKRWREEEANRARNTAAIRNDLLHGGFNRQPLAAGRLKERVEKEVEEFSLLETGGHRGG